MTSFSLISKPSVIDRLWYFSNDTWTINGSREDSGHSLKGKLCESLLSPPVACVSSALAATAVQKTHCCLPLMSLMISVYANSEVWTHLGSKSTLVLGLIFLLVCIVDIVLDVRHCTLCCPGLAVVFTLSIVPICYLKYLNGCGSVWNNSDLSSIISSTDLVDMENYSSQHGTMF